MVHSDSPGPTTVVVFVAARSFSWASASPGNSRAARIAADKASSPITGVTVHRLSSTVATLKAFSPFA
jgi:hypothetical protein